MEYSWPGNIRQLEHVIEHAFIHCNGRIIETHHLPSELINKKKGTAEKTLFSENPFYEIEKEVLLQALEKNGWDKGKTAKMLGISRITLWRRLKKYGINR